MSAAKQNYNIHDKELLAIVEVLRIQRVYAESCSKLTIYTDYKNLTSFTTTKVLNRRQVRQLEQLGQHKFKIIYTLRKDNRRADALSRRSDYIIDKDIISKAILRQEKNRLLVLS